MLVERYNAQLAFEFDRIRDFLVLHYNAHRARRLAVLATSAATWRSRRNCRPMIDLFRDSGRFFRNGNEMFAEISWIQVLVGQGILPRAWHPLVDNVPEAELQRFVDSVGQTISNCVDVMPPHQAFIDRYCKAAPPI